MEICSGGPTRKERDGANDESSRCQAVMALYAAALVQDGSSLSPTICTFSFPNIQIERERY